MRNAVRIDETGKRYGKLVVLGIKYNPPSPNHKWLCRCDCGHQIELTGEQLRRSGKNRSCGCTNNHMKFDEIGKKYGKLLILSYIKNTKRWLCKCDCGNYTEVAGGALRATGANRTFSCGCYFKEKIKQVRNKDITGKKFGRLTVIERAEKRAGGMSYWKCVCDCGKIKIIRQGHLSSGNIISCGCYSKERSKKQLTKHGLYGTPEYRKDPTRKIALNVSAAIRGCLKARNGTKRGSVWTHLPFTPSQLREHLESLFEP